ncbi:MAG: glycosyltransferase family 4 protein [Candidatus Goldbacteria bacterium]|nr:glycosyltransferase family 4 protein [Candidatus Goldiibacteriota bacterium]
MKILFVSHSSVLEYHQQKLCLMAEKFGVQIVLVTPPYWPEGGIDAPVYTGNTSITYETGKVVQFKNHLMHFYLNASEIIKKYNPDIVYLEEDAFIPACAQFIKAAKKAGKKTVFFTWENIHRGYNFIYNKIERYCLKNADAAVAGNKEGADILKVKGFINSVEVIPQYGLNVNDFSPACGFGGGIKEVVYIGRLIEEKGIDTLIEAVSKVKGINLNLIGTGDEEYVNALKSSAAKYNVSERVIFHGFMDRARLNAFIKNMQVLVLPSITTHGWKEQFGRVLIEAFASKIAVIGSDSGEIPNVIADAGLIFREGNPFGLAEAIEKLNNKELYNALIEKGYKRVCENYTNEIIAGKIIALCKALL